MLFYSKILFLTINIFNCFRWNFSVGLHDIKVIMDLNNNCHTTNPSVKLDFKINIPKGVVTAVAFDRPEEVIWTHKVFCLYILIR